MVEILDSFKTVYALGMVCTFILTSVFMLALFIFHTLITIKVYHKYGKRWFWEGVRFVFFGMSDFKWKDAFFTIFILTLMSFGVFFFFFGAWVQKRKDIM